jgi:hypothetical protein
VVVNAPAAHVNVHVLADRLLTDSTKSAPVYLDCPVHTPPREAASSRLDWKLADTEKFREPLDSSFVVTAAEA